MKKIISVLFAASMLFVSTNVNAYSTNELPDVTQGMSIILEAYEPISYTQLEVYENISKLLSDKQKYLMQIANYSSVEEREVAKEKLRITLYLISEWKLHE